jgi:hypothetical protein
VEKKSRKSCRSIVTLKIKQQKYTCQKRKVGHSPQKCTKTKNAHKNTGKEK